MPKRTQPLSTHRAERNFRKTREPRGQVRRTRSLFVVQAHRGRAMHDDFRLATGGVLISWAVPKNCETN